MSNPELECLTWAEKPGVIVAYDALPKVFHTGSQKLVFLYCKWLIYYK